MNTRDAACAITHRRFSTRIRAERIAPSARASTSTAASTSAAPMRDARDALDASLAWTSADVASHALASATLVGLVVFGGMFLTRALVRDTRDLVRDRVARAFAGTFAVTSAMLFLIAYEIADWMTPRALRFWWRACLRCGTCALVGVAPWELFALGIDAVMKRGGEGERGGGWRRTRVAVAATCATGAFAWAFLGASGRRGGGGDGGDGHGALTMFRVVSRAAVLGICLLGVLSGFGAVHFPYTTVRIFHRAIPDAEVSSLERRLVQSVETVIERKKRLVTLQREMERDARAERSGNGGSFLNRLASGFPLPGFREGQAKQIIAIQSEIRALKMVNDTLFFDLHEVNMLRERVKMSRTLYGRFLEVCGVATAVVCGYRFVAGFKRLIFKQTPTSDPISFALSIFLANKSVHIDPAVLAQYLSLLLIAFLVINSMQTFVMQLVRLFFAVGSGVTTDALVLLTTEMVGLYFLSSVLLVREQLPERYRAIITDALGADLEFRFYAKFYELIFMAAAALTVISLYAKHVTSASSDSGVGHSSSASAFLPLTTERSSSHRASELKLS